MESARFQKRYETSLNFGNIDVKSLLFRCVCWMFSDPILKRSLSLIAAWPFLCYISFNSDLENRLPNHIIDLENHFYCISIALVKQ